MPNHVVLASGAIVAVSVAVAVATMLYENPELRRYADDVRRRIQIAMQGGAPASRNSNDEASRDPVFNRPEDADGFLRSGADPGVDADEDTRRRQREELMYWNAIRLSKLEKTKTESEDDIAEKKAASPMARLPPPARRGSSFDDFLRQDESAEKGTFVYNSGADASRGDQSTLRQRGARALGTAFANPFADEHHIDNDDIYDAPAPRARAQDEMTDIYGATTDGHDDDQMSMSTLEPQPLDDEEPTQSQTVSSATLEFSYPQPPVAEPAVSNEAFSSIQAWAQDSSRDFYSPLPATPAAPMSEPELVSNADSSDDDGQLTPTDSASLIDAAEVHSAAGDRLSRYDVMSESSGMMTPASWSEVGSVISESDAAHRN